MSENSLDKFVLASLIVFENSEAEDDGETFTFTIRKAAFSICC
jgi:hypothetical protein